jgi:photosystem II stability/assembly factor-like uncharacterized protein
LLLITVLVLTLSGCTASPTPTTLPTPSPISELKVHSMPATYAYTHQNPDGNRYLKGQREIIVTQSDAQQGAQVVVYSESGERLAAVPAVGRGNRWRHQLAVARPLAATANLNWQRF